MLSTYIQKAMREIREVDTDLQNQSRILHIPRICIFAVGMEYRTYPWLAFMDQVCDTVQLCQVDLRHC